ncbi:MAG: RecX family transcriptional regulator [Balneolaceae bacterium]|nr:RecX family transcriptional regulator [Balneolaceae bacterium]MDR9446696.1 RecX family transcriptional regulator [Balneolaceae bacterium]
MDLQTEMPGPEHWDDEDQVTIKEIQVQKKKRDRFSVFSEQGFLFGLSTDTFIKHPLSAGQILHRKDVLKILETEHRFTVQASLLQYISRRAHARKELLQKAQKKGYDTSIIDSILDDFEHKGWIDDQQFAESFAKDKAKFKSWGPQKIQQHLVQKGIEKHTADDAIAAAIPEDEALQTCLKLLLKKKWYFEKTEDKHKRKQKMMAYLMQRGFTPQLSLQAIEQSLQ